MALETQEIESAEPSDAARLARLTRDELNIIARRLKIPKARRLKKADLVLHILNRKPDIVRQMAPIPRWRMWWEKYHNHVYGIASVIGVFLAVLAFPKSGDKRTVTTEVPPGYEVIVQMRPSVGASVPAQPDVLDSVGRPVQGDQLTSLLQQSGFSSMTWQEVLRIDNGSKRGYVATAPLLLSVERSQGLRITGAYRLHQPTDHAPIGLEVALLTKGRADVPMRTSISFLLRDMQPVRCGIRLPFEHGLEGLVPADVLSAGDETIHFAIDITPLNDGTMTSRLFMSTTPVDLEHDQPIHERRTDGWSAQLDAIQFRLWGQGTVSLKDVRVWR